MYRFKLTATGITSVFAHRDDVVAADKVEEWRKQPENKNAKKGDDRYPGWTWKTYLYYSEDKDNLIGLPIGNLMAALKKGGVEFSLQSSRKSLKAASQTTIRISSPFLPIALHNKVVLTGDDIDAIDGNLPFDEQQDLAKKIGFVIDCRRATVGAAKHVRCRPKFLPGWTFDVEGLVTDEHKIPKKTFVDLFTLVGDQVGVGDWRPGAPKSPGTHGRFTVDVDFI